MRKPTRKRPATKRTEESNVPTRPTRYYLSLSNNVQGPFTMTQLRGMWNAGTITADALYTPEGSTKWAELHLKLEEEKSLADASVQTIESTGKAWKGIMLLAGICTIVGILIIFRNTDDDAGKGQIGSVLICVGLFSLGAAKLGAWWNHG